jgi:hypothetical protein
VALLDGRRIGLILTSEFLFGVRQAVARQVLALNFKLDTEPVMESPSLSFNARKALSVHLGERAGQEVADLLQKLIPRVEELERTKVTVTPIVPEAPARSKAIRKAA